MQAWELSLARAWREASRQDVDPTTFLQKAKELVTVCEKGESASVFKTSSADKFTESSLPKESDVLAFYNQVVLKRGATLKSKVREAAATTMASNSSEYVLKKLSKNKNVNEGKCIPCDGWACTKRHKKRTYPSLNSSFDGWACSRG